MLDGEERDVVEGDEHAAVDEEEREAERSEAALADGLENAGALFARLGRGGFELVLVRLRLGGARGDAAAQVGLGVRDDHDDGGGGSCEFALADEEARDEQDGDGDEGDDAVDPGARDGGEELVDDDGPEDAADGGAGEGDAEGEASFVVEPL